MPGHTESDEAALQRAIHAAPSDDAPWLVYADWLQERGRDADAATLRRFLPDVQAAVRAGRDLPSVMAQVARLGPGASGWGLPAPPRPLPPAPPPEPGAWLRADRSGGRTAHPLLMGLVALAFVGASRVGCEAIREGDPADGDGREKLALRDVFADAQRRAPAVEDPPAGEVRWVGGEPPPGLPASPAAWDPAELVGHALRLEDDRAVLAFAFAAGGTVETRLGRKGGVVLHTTGRWWIDERGRLNITGPDGRRAYLLARGQTAGDRYQVTREGRPEVFVREPSAG